jgi:hypothetical protein
MSLPFLTLRTFYLVISNFKSMNVSILVTIPSAEHVCEVYAVYIYNLVSLTNNLQKINCSF